MRGFVHPKRDELELRFVLELRFEEIGGTRMWGASQGGAFALHPHFGGPQEAGWVESHSSQSCFLEVLVIQVPWARACPLCTVGVWWSQVAPVFCRAYQWLCTLRLHLGAPLPFRSGGHVQFCHGTSAACRRTCVAWRCGWYLQRAVGAWMARSARSCELE